jgi:hypothetical protein
MVPSNPWCRNWDVVDVIGSDQNGSIINLTSTGDVHSTGSDEEEKGIGDDNASSLVSRCVSDVLLYLAHGRTDTLRGAASRRTWAWQSRTSSA